MEQHLTEDGQFKDTQSQRNSVRGSGVRGGIPQQPPVARDPRAGVIVKNERKPQQPITQMVDFAGRNKKTREND